MHLMGLRIIKTSYDRWGDSSVNCKERNMIPNIHERARLAGTVVVLVLGGERHKPLSNLKNRSCQDRPMNASKVKNKAKLAQ
jgi:hypothetical protein